MLTSVPIGRGAYGGIRIREGLRNGVKMERTIKRFRKEIMGTELLVMAIAVVFSFVGLIMFAITRVREIEHNLIGSENQLRLKSRRGYV